MVSRIRYPHITNRVLRGQRSFGHVVAVVFFFVAIMVVRGLRRADRGLCVCALRADPPGVGEVGRSGGSGRNRCFEGWSGSGARSAACD